jgi:hypothetical protein
MKMLAIMIGSIKRYQGLSMSNTMSTIRNAAVGTSVHAAYPMKSQKCARYSSTVDERSSFAERIIELGF